MARTKKRYEEPLPEYSLMVVGSKDYAHHYHSAMAYANYDVDIKKLVKATKTWTAKNTDHDPKILFSLPDNTFGSIGKFCFIMNKGGQFDERHMASIREHIKHLYNKAELTYSSKIDADSEAENSAKKKIGVQEHMKNRACEVAGEIEYLIDLFIDDSKANSFKKFNLEAFFERQEIKGGHYRYIASFYEVDLAEFQMALEGKDAYSVEAYSFLKKSELKELVSFLSLVVETADKLKGKTSYKPRKKKAISKGRRVSKLTYLAKCEMTKLESVSPIHILGASALWVYNTKTRKLGHYTSIDGDGLDISGTSLRNYESGSSECIILRSSKIDLSKLKALSEKVRTKRFDDLTSVKTSLKGRINEHVLLLCVEK